MEEAMEEERGNRLTFHEKGELFACFWGAPLHEAAHPGVGPLPHNGITGSDEVLSALPLLSWRNGSQLRRGRRKRRRGRRRRRGRALLVADEEGREGFAGRHNILGGGMRARKKWSVMLLLLLLERRRKREGRRGQRQMLLLLPMLMQKEDNSQAGFEGGGKGTTFINHLRY